jgi:hypothetical protein
MIKYCKTKTGFCTMQNRFFYFKLTFYINLMESSQKILNAIIKIFNQPGVFYIEIPG